MKKETQEKLETAKGKAPDAAAWSKPKTLALWQSGPKGKVICMGTVAAFLLVVCFSGCGKKEDAKPDSSELLAKQLVEAQAEMQRIQAEAQAKIEMENAKKIAEMEKLRAEADQRMAETEARREEIAAAEQANWNNYRESLAQMQEAMQRQQAEAQAQAEARRAEMDQRRAEAEARQKQIADERAARLKATQEAAQAKKQAIEDARNHVPTDTGTLEASALSEKSFSQVFIGDAGDDEGTIYAHGRDESIRVFQSTSSGLLVGYVQGTSQIAAQVESFMGSLGASFDRVVWVDTKTSLHEENRPLRPGFYVRKGMHAYIGTDGGEHTLAQYVEITDAKTVAMLKDELKRRVQEKKIAEAEAQELAEEHGAIEVDVPIKSLLGFKLGVPPSQVKPLLRNDDGTEVRILDHRALLGGGHTSYRLATPFRLFTRVDLHFSDKGMGKHLERVLFKAERLDPSKYTRESIEEETEATARLIEKKFGIQFEREFTTGTEGQRRYIWRDRPFPDHQEEISILMNYSEFFINFWGLVVSHLDEQLKEDSKTSITLDADVGADLL